MKNIDYPKTKIYTRRQLCFLREIWDLKGKKVAFTNGCFDILHIGHLASLAKAAEQADILIVGLNSDESVRKLKGADRPINKQEDRAFMLANLVLVDGICIFEEETPLELIQALKPDVLIKGGDYTIDQVVGAKEVISWGGKVVINELVDGFSTTGILEKIQHI